MKRALTVVPLLLLTLALGGCVSGAPSGGGAGGARCLSRPDTSGTQPLIYLLCIQTG
jgi:hypothetical protein